jgi:hypothetical protein
MQTYMILRRSAWESAEDLEAALDLAARVADEELPDQVKWIRSYVLDEEDGTLGTMCIYQAIDEDAILEHAQRAEIPADEVTPVINTVVVRDDP